jgi:putative ABC transport system permease protein
MFSYNVKLAIKSMRRNPMMTALMVAAIAVGIGISMTTLSVYYMMNGNPIPEKSERLFAVTMDSWGPLRPFYENYPELAPHQVTHGDAERLLAIGHGKRQTAMYESSLIIEPASDQDTPFEIGARVTHGDFFAMFDVPFIYGDGWDRSADDAAEPMVVLTKQLNEKLFGGENSVGQWVTMNSTRFQVTGVIDSWEPTPRFFDPIEGGIEEVNDLFIPFSLTRSLELVSAGSDWGWKSEDINSFEQWLNSESVWIQYYVELDSANLRDDYVAHLDAYVGEQKKLGRFERPLNNRIYNVMEWLRDYHEVVSDYTKVLVGLSCLSVVVCLMSTITITLTKFVGKKGETSLRRALGASRKVIFDQQIVEIAVIGFAGGVIGLLLTSIGLKGIQYLYASPSGLVRLDWAIMSAAIAIAVVSSTIAGLYPAWRVCQVPPATQLKAQ